MKFLKQKIIERWNEMKIIKVSVLQNLKTFLTVCQSQNSKMKVEPGNLWTSSSKSKGNVFNIVSITKLKDESRAW